MSAAELSVVPPAAECPADAAVAALRAAADNPFSDAVARLDPGLLPPPDVVSLHPWVREALGAAIATVAEQGRAAMVLVKGDPGQGKTHELAWLRARARGAYHFLEVPPLKDPGAPFQHVLRYAVHGLVAAGVFHRFLWEALRRVAAAVRDAAAQEGDEEAADRLSQVLLGNEHFVDSFRALLREDRELAELLLREGRRLPPLLDLDPDFGRVLCRLPLRAAEAAVLDWLRGAELPEEDLALLGVTRPLQSEVHCFEVLRALVRIARRPLVLCFDQVESTRGLLGLAGSVALFNALMEIYQQLPVCLVLMCQTQVWMELLEHVPLAARERIRELPPLSKPTPEDAMRLVAARLHGLWQRAGVEPPYPSYPFAPACLKAYVDEVRPTVRQLLARCGAALERLRARGAGAAGAIDEIGTELGPTPVPVEAEGDVTAPSARSGPVAPDDDIAGDFAEALGREHQRALRDCDGRADLRIPALRQERLRSALTQLLQALAERQQPLGALRLLHVDAPPKPRAGPRPPLIVTLQSGAQRGLVRLALEVHSDDARGAVHVLERLHACVEARAADGAIFLREAEVPVGESARRTQELVRSLEPRGGLYYLPHEAAQRLVAAELLLDAVSAAEVVAADGLRTATRQEALGYLLSQPDLLATLSAIFAPFLPGPPQAAA